jgi:hypothetical protein
VQRGFEQKITKLTKGESEDPGGSSGRGTVSITPPLPSSRLTPCAVHQLRQTECAYYEDSTAMPNREVIHGLFLIAGRKKASRAADDFFV